MGLDPDLFTEEPPEEFNCSICFQVMETPVQCNEGHMCCQACLDEYLRRSPKCPTCSAPLPNQGYARNRAIESLIAAKTVRCEHGPRKEPGAAPQKRQRKDPAESCQWTGKLSELEAHLKTCGYAAVPCPHDGCDAKPRRDALEAHQQTCLQRPSECSQCRAVLKFAEIAAHVTRECPETVLACAKQCGAMVKRVDMAAHQASCPRELVDCPCKGQGCMARPERRNLQQHMQDDAVQHMSFMSAVLSSVQGELRTAQQKCSMLENKLAQVAPSIPIGEPGYLVRCDSMLGLSLDSIPNLTRTITITTTTNPGQVRATAVADG